MSNPEDAFKSLLDDFVKNVEDKEQREKMEDYAVMAGSIAAASAIPGLGEVQMGFQFLDFLDPYGYNQALNRKSVDAILTAQYSNIQDMQNAVLDCYNTSNPDSCKKTGITQDQLTTFAGYSPNVQEKLLKTITSWATPIDPIVKFPSALPCTIATRPEFMTNNCKNEEYKGYYFDYWNKNVASYEADADAAEAAAASSAAEGLSGDTEQDDKNDKHKKTILILLGTVFVVSVYIMYSIMKRLTKKD